MPEDTYIDWSQVAEYVKKQYRFDRCYYDILSLPAVRECKYCAQITAAYLYIVSDATLLGGNADADTRERASNNIFGHLEELEVLSDDKELVFDRCVDIFSQIVRGSVSPIGNWRGYPQGAAENSDGWFTRCFVCYGDLMSDPDLIHRYTRPETGQTAEVSSAFREELYSALSYAKKYSSSVAQSIGQRPRTENYTPNRDTYEDRRDRQGYQYQEQYGYEQQYSYEYERQEQIRHNSYDTSYSPEPAVTHPMKWYKFLIYFSLFAGAALNIFYSLYYFAGLSLGDYKEIIYEVYPSMLYLNLLMGLVCIVLSILMITTRQSLAYKKRYAPMLLYASYAVNGIAPAVYICLLCMIDSALFATSENAIQIVSSIVSAIILIAANYIYFKKRNYIFIN